MDIIKILVAYHKPWKIYQDEIYVPIHAGRQISSFKDEMSSMAGDDSGDHISGKNVCYAEMTVQYWAWKNLHNVEYIGFCHYRRFFDIKLNLDNVDSIFQKWDVILVNERERIPLIMNTVRWIDQENVIIFLKVLKRKHPEYEKAAIDYLWGVDRHSRNMLVCRKEIFDHYAAWMFDILRECENHIKPSAYTSRVKVYGYLSELFMPVYFIHKGYRIKNVRYVDAPNKTTQITPRSYMVSMIKKWHHKLVAPLYRKPTKFEDYYDPGVLAGFKADKIFP